MWDELKALMCGLGSESIINQQEKEVDQYQIGQLSKRAYSVLPQPPFFFLRSVSISLVSKTILRIALKEVRLYTIL